MVGLKYIQSSKENEGKEELKSDYGRIEINSHVRGYMGSNRLKSDYGRIEITEWFASVYFD